MSIEPEALEAQFSQALPDIRTWRTMRFDPIWSQRFHETNACELLHVLQGTLNLICPDAEYQAEPGDTLLLPARTPHRDEFDPDAGLEVFYCTFTWAAEAEYFRWVSNSGLLALAPERKREVARLFEWLRADGSRGGALDKLVDRSRLAQILLFFLRELAAPAIKSEADDAATNYGEHRRKELVRQAKEYLETHYRESVALDDIAAHLHVSSYHLSHVFSAESDFSLFAYLTARRVEKAKALLREGNLNVSEIARAVGYDNANYFAKVFRKQCGCSPREFAAGA